MDSFEWNKIIGAVLATALFVMVLKIASEAVFHVSKPAKPGYAVPGIELAETAQPGAEKPAEAAVPDFGTVIPAADLSHGEQVAQRCTQCHTWDKGGPNRIGPNLFGVIGRQPGTHEGFSYSGVMKNKGGVWTYEELYLYLKQPAMYLPGNKMAFVGLPRQQDRIDLLAFMRTWADSPPPLPAPSPQAVQGGAEGGQTPPADNQAAPDANRPAGNRSAPANGQSAPAPQPSLVPH
ncbi:MAG: c-type cytochrome [Alphaproteobacteria bacterium]